MLRLSLSLLLFLTLLPTLSHAQTCVNPTGYTGVILYNSAHDTFQGCTLRGWMAFHQGDSSGGIPQLGFSFTDLTDQALNVQISSDIALVAGLTVPTSLSLSGLGSPQMRICSAADCSAVVVNWTSTPQMVADGQHMQLRTTSQSTPGGTSRVILSSGGAQTVWDVTTVGGTLGPTGCPNPGDVCPDGTIYVGKTPDGDVDYFTTTLSAPGTHPFNDGSTTGNIDSPSQNCPEGSTVTSAAGCRTGEANTNAVAIADSSSVAGFQPHVAPLICYCWGEEHASAPNGTVPPECVGHPASAYDGRGHDDWYLPAIAEVDIMYKNLVSPSDPDNPVAIFNGGAGNTDAPNDGPQAGTLSDTYSSSSETGGCGFSSIWQHDFFTTGSLTAFCGTRNALRPVRCVRK